MALPKLDDESSSTPSLCPISSYFYRVPSRGCMQGRLLYADGGAYMYMLSAHQQIEPARPPITSNDKQKIRARGQRHGQGAWSFARRGRFKIAAKVGRFPQRRPGPSWALAGIGWLWMAPALLLPAIACSCWFWMALAGCSFCSCVAFVKTEGRGQPAMVQRRGQWSPV